ncbi:hypothetical protein BIM11_6224 [Burkholderia pseudomallei]|nr:hypothetical protein BIM11_6224 [Burkholderia pseudomallei]
MGGESILDLAVRVDDRPQRVEDRVGRDEPLVGRIMRERGFGLTEQRDVGPRHAEFVAQRFGVDDADAAALELEPQPAHLIAGAARLAHAARHARVEDVQRVLEPDADAVEIERDRHVDEQRLERARQQQRDLARREVVAQLVDGRAQLRRGELDGLLVRVVGARLQQLRDRLAGGHVDQRIVARVAAHGIAVVLVDRGDEHEQHRNAGLHERRLIERDRVLDDRMVEHLDLGPYADFREVSELIREERVRIVVAAARLEHDGAGAERCDVGRELRVAVALQVRTPQRALRRAAIAARARRQVQDGGWFQIEHRRHDSVVIVEHDVIALRADADRRVQPRDRERGLIVGRARVQVDHRGAFAQRLARCVDDAVRGDRQIGRARLARLPVAGAAHAPAVVEQRFEHGRFVGAHPFDEVRRQIGVDSFVRPGQAAVFGGGPAERRELQDDLADQIDRR